MTEIRQRENIQRTLPDGVSADEQGSHIRPSFTAI